MQPSVRAITPSLVDGGRRGSAASIIIDQEVSVVSTLRDGFNELGQRTTDSTMPSMPNGHARQRSRGSTVTVTVPPLNRWNSESRRSDNSRASSLHQPQSHFRGQSSIDSAFLENNRESMRALSDFLRTKEPPADNFMSIPDSDTTSIRSIKKSVFKMFGRQKSKKAKPSKLMQLPDSAVSATTRDGARHIAISIPVEFDQLNKRFAQQITQDRPFSQPNKVPPERQALVTVLKPVQELRESPHSPSFKNHWNKQSQQSTVSPPRPMSELVGSERAEMLPDNYTQLNPQISTGRGDDSSNPQSSYTTISPLAMNPQDSGQSNIKHSGGNHHSTKLNGVRQGGHQGISSVSTAPSMNGIKFDIQPRTSSISKVSRSLKTELAQTFEEVNHPHLGRSRRLSDSSEKADSLLSGTSKSHSPLAVVRTAEVAQAYHTAGGEIIRGHTPKAHSPASTRRLPDVPENLRVLSSVSRLSPPPNDGKKTPPIVIQAPKRTSETTRIGPKDPVQPVRQSRQDRVKARKVRDMAALREKSANTQGYSAINGEPAPRTRSNPVPRDTKQRSVSSERNQRRRKNTLSGVLLVADFPPSTQLVNSEEFWSRSPERISAAKASSSSNLDTDLSGKGTHTPPQSSTSSQPSDSDAATKEEEQGRGFGSRSPGLPHSGLDSQRQERRNKRNMSLREREMEARLQRIEKDNVMLLTTLSGIAKSFGELSKILPTKDSRRDGEGLFEPDLVAEVMEPHVRKMRSLEPVMRELQGSAGKVSGETWRT